MSDKKDNQIETIHISDDAYVYRYGMTIKELREEIQYKIASVTVSYPSTIQMSSGGDDDGVTEENEQVDSEEWDVDLDGNPLFNQPQNWSKWLTINPQDVQGTGHASTEWTDEELKNPYTPSWANEVVQSLKPKCEHKLTRDVELIFTVATECIDCGERLK